MEFCQRYAKYIIFRFRMYDSRIEWCEEADLIQEVAAAMAVSDENSVWKNARANIESLLSQLGHSRKKGKDNFEPFYCKIEHADFETEALKLIEKHYQNGQWTAKDVARYFNIPFNNRLAKLLCEAYPKNMGKGGARRGAGRKKQTM